MLDTRLQHTPHPLERLCATRRATRAAKLAADHRRAKLPLGPVVFGPVVCRRHLLVVEKHKQVIPLLLQPTLDQSPQSQSANQLDPASVADPPSLLTLLGGIGPVRREAPASPSSTPLLRSKVPALSADTKTTFPLWLRSHPAPSRPPGLKSKPNPSSRTPQARRIVRP